jgi:hypothetical protein
MCPRVRQAASLLLVLLLVAGLALAQTKDPKPPDLAPLLGPAAARWQAAPAQGTKADLTIAEAAGRKFLAVGPSGLVLTAADRVAGDSELRLRFRLTTAEARGCQLAVAPGLAKPGDQNPNPLLLQLTVGAGADPESLQWLVHPLPGEKTAAYGNYSVSDLPKSRLSWPDAVRRRFEENSAGEQRITRRWLTLRYQLRKNGYRVYLDDRLLREGRHPRLDTTGFVRLSFGQGAEIAALAVDPLPAEDVRFETVGLEGYVNAGRFRGEAFKLDALGPGKTLAVGGVPFALATPDERGLDHIDLKPSWLACGLVEGAFFGGEGDLSRWRGAMDRDPARIQFRVRNGHYSRLHLLAAYSGEPDTTPVVTAQFFRDYAGHPVNFAGRAPPYSAPGRPHAVTVPLGGGKANLHLVTIPLEPDGLAAFSDLDHLDFELTKEVRVRRDFPDPVNYSVHGAGLPSGVHVFGVTLERPAVEVDFQPDNFAHVWTAPAQPSYTARLHNTSAQEQAVALELTTTSDDGREKTSVRQGARLAAGAAEAVKLPLALKRYGRHAVELKITSGGEVRTQRRALAHLHPDTRERGGWEEGKGPIFGFWDWGGGHVTPGGINRLKVMAAAGLESTMQSFAFESLYPAEEKAFLESIGAQSFFLAYQLAMSKDTLGGKEWDPNKPGEMQAALVRWLKSQPMARPSKINKPELAVFFAEPLLGPVSYMSQPEHYGEPPHQMTAEERANYKKYLDQFVIAATAIKKEWPKARCLMPWGIPTFPIPFLRESKEARDLMDGPAIDIVLFERPPEMQLHQVTFSSCLWQLRQEWLKTGKPWPSTITIEGPAVSPAAPGALTPAEEADHTIRAYMHLAAYGTTRHLGWPSAFNCAGYWGETHYGGGLCDRLPLLSPRPAYCAYATMTRQLNRMNFVKVVPAGSNTVFCFQFKHYKTGELLHVFWTLRGGRGVSIAADPGKPVTVHDSMDNLQHPAINDRTRVIWVTASPCYVRGMADGAKITLGPPDHSDAEPAPNAVALAHLGDGSWKLSAERDPAYEDSHPEFIRRFPGKFSVKPEAAPEKYGKGLAVRLEKQEKERKTMPFFTTLVPAKPIVLPGKPSHLGLWVRAASDWGRVVYCLRDAKGERWVSVGQKGEWNVDDVHCWSQFCFDGWRYLRFELPGNSPYDAFREMGTSFWGHYGPGDAVVDYPLSLEKVIVERRTHVIAGTELVPAAADDVLLGGLFAEYEKAADQTPEAVRLAGLRMALPAATPELSNPLTKLRQAGVGEGPAITKVEPPEREYDGKRCLVHFPTTPGAAKYDVWVSPYADGRGAVQLAAGWAAPGQLLTGLSPNVDLYLFAVATDKQGKLSKPGPGFKINLKDMFPMK